MSKVATMGILRLRFNPNYRRYDVDESAIKKGKPDLSHRYNRLPLLPSGPGGLDRSWS